MGIDDAPSVPSSKGFEDITIRDASRAASAAPIYLPVHQYKGESFWDGGMLNNNPINQVWEARHDLAPLREDSKLQRGDSPYISCIVSVGTGNSPRAKVVPEGGSSLWSTVKHALSFVTNTEAKHRDFKRMIRRENLRKGENQQTEYFRFNAKTTGSEINLDDWQRMAELEEDTRKYIE